MKKGIHVCFVLNVKEICRWCLTGAFLSVYPTRLWIKRVELGYNVMERTGYFVL